MMIIIIDFAFFWMLFAHNGIPMAIWLHIIYHFHATTFILCTTFHYYSFLDSEYCVYALFEINRKAVHFELKMWSLLC